MKCRVCGSSDLELTIDLGMQPWCNNFLKKEDIGKEPIYPLRVVYCIKCSTAQLDYTVKKEIMFGDHTYLSGVTKSLSKHFEETAKYVDKTFFRDENKKNVLDIGSNDGTQLIHYKELGYDVLGVESSITTAKMANDNNINTLNAFFNEVTAQEIATKFDVINASGVFFHLEELHSVTKAIKDTLKKDGVFVVQFLYMKKIIENLAFDQIYHEHLLYYNLKNIEYLLNQFGLEMFDAYLSPIHGGSIIGFVGHKGNREKSDRYSQMYQDEIDSKSNDIETYHKFAVDIKELRNRNLQFLHSKKDEGKKVYAMGAPVKGNTLLNYFDIGTDLIEFLVEKNTLRKGLYSPGKHIPIVLEDELKSPPDVYYGLAWNFKNEILKNNQDLIDQGVEFYFPINPKE